jgi:hypothetical protein
MRRLVPNSARLLASKLGKLINTVSILKVGEVYSRERLKSIFRITDATINNGVFEPKGHDSIWLFITESKTPDRTQYADLLAGDALYFDGQTEGRTDASLISHHADGRDVLLFYRKTKFELPGAGFTFEGRFSYTTHEGGRPTRFTFTRQPLATEDEVVEAVERLSGRQTSQGFSVPPRVRMAIDKYAMKAAISHFETNGYTVDDVHTKQPVDLIVRRGGEVRRVEVKGTQTTGEQVLLTAGEVGYARLHRPEMMLFILSEVSVHDGGEGAVMVAGGTIQLRAWDVDAGVLQPLAYRYTPPRA